MGPGRVIFFMDCRHCSAQYVIRLLCLASSAQVIILSGTMHKTPWLVSPLLSGHNGYADPIIPIEFSTQSQMLVSFFKSLLWFSVMNGQKTMTRKYYYQSQSSCSAPSGRVPLFWHTLGHQWSNSGSGIVSDDFGEFSASLMELFGFLHFVCSLYKHNLLYNIKITTIITSYYV